MSLWEYTPLVGDIWDIYSGTNKLLDPNLRLRQRALGAGQAILGAGGLATLGAGSIAKSAGKAGIKGLAKFGEKEAIKNYINKYGAKKSLNPRAYNNSILLNRLSKGAEKFINSPLGKINNVVNAHPMLTSGGFEIANMLLSKPTSSDNQEVGQDTTQMGNGNSQPITPQVNVARTGSGYYSGTSGVVNPQAINQAVNNTTTVQQPNGAENNTQESGIDPGEIYRRYLDKQEALEPYRRGLQNYVRDYHRLSDLSYNQDKYLALLAAQTGATGLNNIIGKYTALGDEAKALDLQKLYGNEIKNVGEGLDKLQGNIAMAQQMGLPIESVLADDDYVKLALQKEINEDRINSLMQRALLNNELGWARYNLSKAKLSSGGGRSGGRTSKGNTIGAYNILSRMIEEGNDPSEAARFVNSNFGTNFTAPPTSSTNLYGGRTLHR